MSVTFPHVGRHNVVPFAALASLAPFVNKRTFYSFSTTRNDDDDNDDDVDF